MFSATRVSLFQSLMASRKLTSSAQTYKRDAHRISVLASSPLSSLQFPVSLKIRTKMSTSPTNPDVRSTVHGEETVKEEDIAWRTAHPYVKPSDDDDFKTEWEGSCHCGSVKYLLGREKPLSSKYCHCVDCQRMHAVSEDSVRLGITFLRRDRLLTCRHRLHSSGQQSSTSLTFASSMAPKD